MQLAQSRPELNVIGLGAQDSIELATDFVEFTETADAGVTMIYDPTFASWRSFGIRSQPYWVLFDDQGNELVSRPGGIDENVIDELLGATS